MLIDLTPIEQKWLRMGMTEEMIEHIRKDPGLRLFAMLHLEGVRPEESDPVSEEKWFQRRRGGVRETEGGRDPGLGWAG